MIRKLFSKSKLLSEEDEYFQIECFKWLLTHFGGDSFYKESKLVLPTNDYFPDKVESNESAAESTFKQVLKYAGMEDWPVELVEHEQDPDLQVAETIVIQKAEHNPLGTFSINENKEVKITYNPRLTANPLLMVSTFAHEISHYLTACAPEPPPGGWGNWEFVTDIAATFIGFGVFQANSAFEFKQITSSSTMGWQTSRAGYLSEAEHCYALAIFLGLKGIDSRLALEHCKKNVSSNLKKALKELDESEIMDDLKTVKYIAKNSET